MSCELCKRVLYAVICLSLLCSFHDPPASFFQWVLKAEGLLLVNVVSERGFMIVAPVVERTEHAPTSSHPTPHQTTTSTLSVCAQAVRHTHTHQHTHTPTHVHTPHHTTFLHKRMSVHRQAHAHAGKQTRAYSPTHVLLLHKHTHTCTLHTHTPHAPTHSYARAHEQARTHNTSSPRQPRSHAPTHRFLSLSPLQTTHPLQP